ncbi:hypothetical protein [Cohnella sp. GCM10027633]|uniref:hypothetical protein n=1 Tax=unclassified Cohnella TaxID=2636738 RepID=UPI00363435AA
MTSESAAIRKLREEIVQAARGNLTEEQLAAILGQLDSACAYEVRATGDPHQFSAWVTLRTFESKRVGEGVHRLVDTGIPVISRDLEFGKHIRYEYQDAGIRIHNEEQRISNFNTTAVIASLIHTEETGDRKSEPFFRSLDTLNLYVPRRL